jgi:hypothetical protein
VNAANALAEARRAYAEQLARQPEIDEISTQLAAHLVWIRQNPDAVWNLLRRQPPNQPTHKGNQP